VGFSLDPGRSQRSNFAKVCFRELHTTAILGVDNDKR